MKRLLKLLAISTLCLALIVVTTRPSGLPSVFLVVPFGLIFVMLTLLVLIMLRWQRPEGDAKAPRKAALIAALPTLLLVLQSVGQLTVRDALTIAALFVLAAFYMHKVRASA
jgi:hypothetical protein